MVTVLLTLRVWAVYGQDKTIGIALFSVYIGCWTAAFVVIGFFIQHVMQLIHNQYSPSFSVHIQGCASLTQAPFWHSLRLLGILFTIVAGLVLLYDSGPSTMLLNCGFWLTETSIVLFTFMAYSGWYACTYVVYARLGVD